MVKAEIKMKKWENNFWLTFMAKLGCWFHENGPATLLFIIHLTEVLIKMIYFIKLKLTFFRAKVISQFKSSRQNKVAFVLT